MNKKSKHYIWIGRDSYKGLNFLVVDIIKDNIIVHIDDIERAAIVQCSDHCKYFNNGCKWQKKIYKDEHLVCIPTIYFKSWIKRRLIVKKKKE